MNINLTIKKSFSRAAMMLLATILLSMTAQPAWAETVDGVKYIDANGDEQTRDGVIVLTGSETTLGENGGTESSPKETWYLCDTNRSYTSTLSSYNYCNVNIILADGVEMKVESSSSTIGLSGSLGIYGQSTGTNMGKFTAKSTYKFGNAVSSSGSITISHCKLIAECSDYGISSGNSGDIIISGAEVTATGDYAIYSAGGVSITGGKVTANGTSYGIYASGTDDIITISGAEVTATGNHAISAGNGSVSITDGSTVTATSTGSSSVNGIYVYKDVTISSSEVTAEGNVAIFVSSGGVSITGGKVTANGTSYGIYASGTDKNITIEDAEVTATATGTSGYAIYSSNGGVSITGGKVTSNGKYYGIGAGGSDKDITISGAEVTATGKSAIGSSGAISITDGSTVTANGTSEGIFTSNYGDVTIIGSKVTATATDDINDKAIYSWGGSISISDAEVTAEGNNAIYTPRGGISITGGKVTANGIEFGIEASGSDKNITIEDAEVTATANGTSGNAIYTPGGGISITGGKVTANGTDYGIRASQDITIEGAEVTATATGTSGSAIYTYGGSASITGGKVTANGIEFGIEANNDITISNAEVTATANYAIDAADVSITGGEVTANGTTYGINGSIIINDGTVSITGATAISNINSYVVNGGKVTLNSTSGDVYKVTFDGNEWSDKPEVSLYSGSTVAEPTTPARKGYIFGGWKNGSTLYDFNMPVTGNLTLVSVWEMKTLTHTDITIADIADQICTGSEIKPAVSIKDGETDLTEGVDYDLAYSNNINVGTATVTITGKDGYAGTGTKEFVILRGMSGLFADGNQWTGYVAQEDLALPDGLTAYTVTALGDKTATATAIGYLPKDEPVLLRREDKAVNNYVAGPYEGTEAAPTGNLLRAATASSQPTAYRDYLLYQDGFVLVSGGTLATGQVYLSVPQASQSRTATRSIIIDGDGTTAISTTDRTALTDEGSGAWFDMQGRRYDSKPTRKGLYVRNGKKVVIK